MKKHVHRDNRRRKKTVAERKAARARCVAAMTVTGIAADLFRETKDERAFLLDVMSPVKAAIEQILAPHLAAEWEGETWPANEAVEYAFDLIFDNEDEDDPLAAVIWDVYRDGPETVLPHLERALQWREI